MVLSCHIMEGFAKKCWSGSAAALTLCYWKGDCKNYIGQQKIWFRPGVPLQKAKGDQCLSLRIPQPVLIPIPFRWKHINLLKTGSDLSHSCPRTLACTEDLATSPFMLRVYYAYSCAESWQATARLSLS